jgi:ribonucleoside-diphosphate reductase alpha chain
MSGISFLPHSDHTYQQAPYQECSKEEYNKLLKAMPRSIKWSALCDYEKEDNTAAMQTLACTGDTCEIVDLT